MLENIYFKCVGKALRPRVAVVSGSLGRAGISVNISARRSEAQDGSSSEKLKTPIILIEIKVKVLREDEFTKGFKSKS